MKSKKDKQKISITAINQNNIVKNKATPNLKSFLLKKYISRNNNINNISTLNSLYLKKTFFTKCRNDKTKSKVLINLTKDIKQNNMRSFNNYIDNTEIKTKNENNHKNKSSDNLPNRINNINYISQISDENNNQMFNPINRKKCITYNICSENENNNFEDNKINKLVYDTIYYPNEDSCLLYLMKKLFMHNHEMKFFL